jgi:predicted kinase
LNHTSLIVVTGHPATGKTTLLNTLSSALCIPGFGKDALKETFFDAFGTGDREFSKRTGRASIALLYTVAQTILTSGNDVLIESNFDPAFAREELLALARKASNAQVRVLELNVTCNAEQLLARFALRAHGGSRHPGHNDNAGMLSEIRTRLARDSTARLFPDADAGTLALGGVPVNSWVFDTSGFVAGEDAPAGSSAPGQTAALLARVAQWRG